MRFFLITIIVASLSASVSLAQTSGLDGTDEELFNKIQDQLKAAGGSTPRGLGIVTGSNTKDNTTSTEEFTNLSEIKTDTGAVVTTANRVNEQLEINILIKFEFDSAALAASEQTPLNQMCRVMQKSENVNLFQIVGHTDSAGSDAYNQRLSQLRAEEVKRHLVTVCGIDATRLQAVGYGEEFPNNKVDPRAPENRRVELQVLG